MSRVALPELHLCVPVDTAWLKESREEMRRFLQAHGVEEQTAEDLVLCAHEACANAIEHSLSRTDIDVYLYVGSTSVTVVVADKGLGLDLGLHDLQRKPELLQASGRGLYVMASLMDELDVYLDGGTAIRMNRQLAPRPSLTPQ